MKLNTIDRMTASRNSALLGSRLGDSSRFSRSSSGISSLNATILAEYAQNPQALEKIIDEKFAKTKKAHE